MGGTLFLLTFTVEEITFQSYEFPFDLYYFLNHEDDKYNKIPELWNFRVVSDFKISTGTQRNWTTYNFEKVRHFLRNCHRY